MAVTPAARDLLVAHLDDDDPAIVEAAGLCLVVVGHSETPERLDLAPRLVIVAERVDRCLQILLLLDDRFDLEPLAWALRDEIATAARRIEVLLELVHESRAIGSAVSNLASVVARDRSTALEMLEVTVGRSLGRLALALVDPTLDHATRHQQLAEHTAVGSRTLGEWLLDLVMDEEAYWRDPWLRACAMYALPGELPAPAAVALVSPFLHDRDSDVAETARWVTDRWVAPDRVPLDVPGT